MAQIDLDPIDLAKVLDILQHHLPDREVWAFGSRVSMTAKKFSDLDLAVMGSEPLSSIILSALQEAFRESDLPFKVDLVDWAVTDPFFKKIIERKHAVLKERSE